MDHAGGGADAHRFEQPAAVTIRQLLNEEQDEGISRKLVTALSSKLERGERVQAVSVQQKLVINIVTEAIVATTERLLIVRDLVFGKNIEAVAYHDIASISVKKELLGATVSITTGDRRTWTIGSLPRKARRSSALDTREDGAGERRTARTTNRMTVS